MTVRVALSTDVSMSFSRVDAGTAADSVKVVRFLRKVLECARPLFKGGLACARGRCDRSASSVERWGFGGARRAAPARERGTAAGRARPDAARTPGPHAADHRGRQR